MKKILGNPSGFTLVELMVVVAIIGILSAIAVPNFKKYQAKSKQSEAKIQLAAVYSTEVSANADYDTYATCIKDLGYEVPPKGYYIVGFSAHDGTTAGYVTTRDGRCDATGTFAILPTKLLEAAAGNTDVAAADLDQSVAPTTDSFTAGASGNISNAVALDKWTIDKTKALINSTVGF